MNANILNPRISPIGNHFSEPASNGIERMNRPDGNRLNAELGNRENGSPGSYPDGAIARTWLSQDSYRLNPGDPSAKETSNIQHRTSNLELLGRGTGLGDASARKGLLVLAWIVFVAQVVGIVCGILS